MDITELVNKINNKEVSTKELAQKYNISIRTLQNRIREQGFAYNKSSRNWTYTSDQEDVNSNAPIKRKEPITRDMIEKLLTSKPTPIKNRTFKGFYLDEDVLSIVDSVPTGKRSDLINEVLREAFKDRGRL